MSIVSISLTEENISALENIQKCYGLTGRSEAIRHSIRAAESEIREISDMDGSVEGVLVIVHKVAQSYGLGGRGRGWGDLGEWH